MACSDNIDPRAAAAPETYQRELLRLLAGLRATDPPACRWRGDAALLLALSESALLGERTGEALGAGLIDRGRGTPPAWAGVWGRLPSASICGLTRRVRARKRHPAGMTAPSPPSSCARPAPHCAPDGAELALRWRALPPHASGASGAAARSGARRGGAEGRRT